VVLSRAFMAQESDNPAAADNQQESPSVKHEWSDQQLDDQRALYELFQPIQRQLRDITHEYLPPREIILKMCQALRKALPGMSSVLESVASKYEGRSSETTCDAPNDYQI
jgi:hypothetical protein